MSRPLTHGKCTDMLVIELDATNGNRRRYSWLVELMRIGSSHVVRTSHAEAPSGRSKRGDFEHAIDSYGLKTRHEAALCPSSGTSIARAGTRGRVTFTVYGKAHQVPRIQGPPPTRPQEILDVVILGGGLSGLTALHELKDLKVRLLEWGDDFGGLAAQGKAGRHVYARCAAYFSRPRREVAAFYQRLGLGRPKRVEIAGVIDSYFVKGIRGRGRILIKDIWDDHALKRLPPEFKTFKEFLVNMRDYGMIGDVPLEDQPKRVLMWDHITVADMLLPFGPQVKELIDLYCRSALGRASDHLSAMAFLNFYIDEIERRYAFAGGTAGVAKRIETIVHHDKPESLVSGACIYDVHHRSDGLVEVRYCKDGKNLSLLARQAIAALPLHAASKVITDLPQQRRDLLASIKYANYLVHNIVTPEVIFTESYDTWVNRVSFQDVIVGRWCDTRGFTKAGSKKGLGILTVYQPLPTGYDGKQLKDSDVKALATKALVDLEKLFPKLKGQTKVHIESSRWWKSIHIAELGHVTEKGPRLRAPHGKILFAGNNLGIPSFEEAIHRGLAAANDARNRHETTKQARKTQR